MPLPKSRAARSKRTKDELINELETLEEKLQGTEAPDPTAQAVAKENASKVRETVKALSVDTIVASGAKFGLDVQRTVANLTEQAVQKAEELKTLQEAIDIETAELERLYELDVVSASTAALIEEHKAKKSALEKEIAAARQAWEEEKTAHQKMIAQRNADLEAARRRDQQEYDYRTRQERERAQEEFKYNQSLQERALSDRIAAADKELELRKAEVAKQEAELATFKARIEGLDAEIKAKVDKEVAIATSSVKKELTNQFTMEKKDLEMQLRLEQQKVSNLEASNEKLTAEIAKLHVQLEAARSEVREIAKSAVEGASGNLALQKVMEVRQDNGSPTRSGKS